MIKFLSTGLIAGVMLMLATAANAQVTVGIPGIRVVPAHPYVYNRYDHRDDWRRNEWRHEHWDHHHYYDRDGR